MTNKEMIINVLNNCGCQTTFQIKGAIFRKFGVSISPQSAAGVLRPLVDMGFAAKSPDASGKMVYWLTSYGKDKLFK